ncbi:MAG: DivIVA domain-containing protein [Oscillospiraceae bacterium]|nr:DivIVA domain-containing protein [Oscillospiraceae bacterium]
MSKDPRDAKMFEKAAFGYRAEEVDRYVEERTRKIEALEAEKADQQAKMKILADKINEYRAEEGNLKDALLEAQRIKNAIEADARTRSEKMVTDAEEHAAHLKAEAKAHATRLLSEAKARADQMVADAKKQAEEAIGSVRGQVETEQRTLARMQREVSTFKSTLISIYRSHLNLITSLPEEERKSAQSAPEAPAAKPAEEHPAETETPAAETHEETEAERQAAFAERFGEVKIKDSEPTE